MWSFKKVILFIICVCGVRVYVYVYWHCSMHLEVKRQLLRVGFLFSLWIPNIKLRSSDLGSKCFYPLSHIAGPVIFVNYLEQLILQTQFPFFKCRPNIYEEEWL